VCLLLSQYLNLSDRNTEEDSLISAELREALGLTHILNRSTISRMLKCLVLSRLETMSTQVINRLEGMGKLVALNPTEFCFT
jgi:hypothetical protein